MPLLHKTTLRKWWSKHPHTPSAKKIYLFCDEFTNYNDVETGIKAILLLEKLGYEVVLPEHLESGRTLAVEGVGAGSEEDR